MVTFSGSELSKRARDAGLSVAEFGIGTLSFMNPLIMWRLWQFFRRQKVSCIVLNLPSDVKAAGVSAWLAGVPQIIYRRGTAKTIRDTLLNRFLFRRVVTDVIVNSGETKRIVMAGNPNLFPAERIKVIYNGIDLESFDAQPAQPIYNRKIGDIVLGHAGRLALVKNQAFLIDVIRLIKDAGVRCSLLMAGKGSLEAELKAQAVSLGLENEVVFLGFQDEVRSFMSAIDIFLFSSHSEGGANVLLEAMAAGKPVVAFNSSSTPEIVQDQVSGLLVPPGDKEAFLTAVLELIRNPERRAKLGIQGRKRVEQLFDINYTLAEVKSLIR